MEKVTGEEIVNWLICGIWVVMIVGFILAGYKALGQMDDEDDEDA